MTDAGDRAHDFVLGGVLRGRPSRYRGCGAGDLVVRGGDLVVRGGGLVVRGGDRARLSWNACFCDEGGGRVLHDGGHRSKDFAEVL